MRNAIEIPLSPIPQYAILQIRIRNALELNKALDIILKRRSERTDLIIDAKEREFGKEDNLLQE